MQDVNKSYIEIPFPLFISKKSLTLISPELIRRSYIQDIPLVEILFLPQQTTDYYIDIYSCLSRYEFVHSPLCGPAVIPASTEGELHFPHYEALGYTEPPRSIRCIWEIRVNRDRDVWLHFDKVIFPTHPTMCIIF